MNQNQEHDQGQEGEAVGVRGSEGDESLRSYTYRSEAFSGVGARIGSQSLTVDREVSKEGIGGFNPFGGVIDQLIVDARKQLVKSEECIVWYREEVKEYQEKLDNLVKLKELQEQQQQQMREAEAKSFNDHSEGSLAE